MKKQNQLDKHTHVSMHMRFIIGMRSYRQGKQNFHDQKFVSCKTRTATSVNRSEHKELRFGELSTVGVNPRLSPKDREHKCSGIEEGGCLCSETPNPSFDFLFFLGPSWISEDSSLMNFH